MSAHTKSKRYTWRKGKCRDGMMRLMPSYTLHCGSDKILLRAQQSNIGLWYWYGDGQNTAHDLKTFDEVKADAVAYAKANNVR